MANKDVDTLKKFFESKKKIEGTTKSENIFITEAFEEVIDTIDFNAKKIIWITLKADYKTRHNFQTNSKLVETEIPDWVHIPDYVKKWNWFAVYIKTNDNNVYKAWKFDENLFDGEKNDIVSAVFAMLLEPVANVASETSVQNNNKNWIDKLEENIAQITTELKNNGIDMSYFRTKSPKTNEELINASFDKNKYELFYLLSWTYNWEELTTGSIDFDTNTKKIEIEKKQDSVHLVTHDFNDSVDVIEIKKRKNV